MYPVRDLTLVGLEVRITAKQTTKVGISPIIKCKCTCGLHDHALITSAFEIAEYHLEGLSMGLLGVVVETCDLTHCVTDVRSCVSRQIKQHAHDGWITPILFVGWTVRINAEGFRGCRRPVGVAVVETLLQQITFLMRPFCVSVMVPDSLSSSNLIPRNSLKVPSRVRIKPRLSRSAINLSMIFMTGCSDSHVVNVEDKHNVVLKHETLVMFTLLETHLK